MDLEHSVACEYHECSRVFVPCSALSQEGEGVYIAGNFYKLAACIVYFFINVSRYMRADNKFNLHVNRIVQIEHARLHHGLKMHIFIKVNKLKKCLN